MRQRRCKRNARPRGIVISQSSCENIYSSYKLEREWREDSSCLHLFITKCFPVRRAFILLGRKKKRNEMRNLVEYSMKRIERTLNATENGGRPAVCRVVVDVDSKTLHVKWMILYGFKARSYRCSIDILFFILSFSRCACTACNTLFTFNKAVWRRSFSSIEFWIHKIRIHSKGKVRKRAPLWINKIPWGYWMLCSTGHRWLPFSWFNCFWIQK